MFNSFWKFFAALEPVYFCFFIIMFNYFWTYNNFLRWCDVVGDGRG